MSKNTTHTGTCFCGAVEIAVDGTPVAMGYCHCRSCRHWSASPVNAFTLWRVDALQVTRGRENLNTYNRTPRSYRTWCVICGGHLYTEHPLWGLVDVYAAILPTLLFEPGVHVHCSEAVLAIRDGLPRQRDLPEEMGGSGVLMSQPRRSLRAD